MYVKSVTLKCSGHFHGGECYETLTTSEDKANPARRQAKALGWKRVKIGEVGVLDQVIDVCYLNDHDEEN